MKKKWRKLEVVFSSLVRYFVDHVLFSFLKKPQLYTKNCLLKYINLLSLLLVFKFLEENTLYFQGSKYINFIYFYFYYYCLDLCITHLTKNFNLYEKEKEEFFLINESYFDTVTT